MPSRDGGDGRIEVRFVFRQIALVAVGQGAAALDSGCANGLGGAVVVGLEIVDQVMLDGATSEAKRCDLVGTTAG
jgi:hypothetical protein